MKGSLHTDELMGAVVRARGRAAHGAAGQPLLRDGRAVLCRDADRHRRRDQHRADDGDQGRHHPERDRPRARDALSRGARRDPVGDGDGQPEGAVDGRGGRAVQDGGPRPDHRRHPRRAARARQRDQPRVGQDQEDRFAGRRPRQRARRARPRGRQHARQEPVVPRGRRCRGHRARREGADHPHEPRRLDHDAARVAAASRRWSRRRGGRRRDARR